MIADTVHVMPWSALYRPLSSSGARALINAGATGAHSVSPRPKMASPRMIAATAGQPGTSAADATIVQATHQVAAHSASIADRRRPRMKRRAMTCAATITRVFAAKAQPSRSARTPATPVAYAGKPISNWAYPKIRTSSEVPTTRSAARSRTTSAQPAVRAGRAPADAGSPSTTGSAGPASAPASATPEEAVGIRPVPRGSDTTTSR